MSTLLMDLVLKSLVVAAFGLLAARALKRGAAATRHLVLTLTLAGLLVLPVVTLLMPRWQVPFLRVKVAAPAPVQVNPAPTTSVVALPSQPEKSPLPLPIILWSVVAGAIALKVGVRLTRLSRMERKLAMSADPILQSMVAEKCRQKGRHVLLLEGAANEPPMTWGHFRPVLLLPSDAGEWQESRLQSVVLHELAHIERGDWLSSLVAQAACAVYWFNPLVWVIAAQMGRESESAADDRVIGQGLSAAQYASHLIEVLRDLRGSKRAADAALAMARPGSLDGRVRAILEERRCRRPIRGFAVLGLVGGLSGLVVLIGAAGPTIIREVAQAGPEVRGETDHAASPPTFSIPTPPTKKQIVRHEVRAPRTHVVASRTQITSAKVANAVAKTTKLWGDKDDLDVDLSGITKGMPDVTKEVESSLKEARKEVQQSMAEAQRDIDKAKAAGADVEVGQAAVNFGMTIAQSALKDIGTNLKKTLGQMPKMGAKPPAPKTKTNP